MSNEYSTMLESARAHGAVRGGDKALRDASDQREDIWRTARGTGDPSMKRSLYW